MKPISRAYRTPQEPQLTAWIHWASVPCPWLPHQHSDLNRLCHLKVLPLLPQDSLCLLPLAGSDLLTLEMLWLQRCRHRCRTRESSGIGGDQRQGDNLVPARGICPIKPSSMISARQQECISSKDRRRREHASYSELRFPNFNIHVNNWTCSSNAHFHSLDLGC